jgi:glycosyltransferase involved in cell wall biosynthesis
MSTSLISVIIRTKNEAKWIGTCLQAINLQDYPAMEVIVVDNESTDATLDICSRYNAVITSISNMDFNYSRALNRGIEIARGELIAIISGHCVPVHDYWLANLYMHFRDPQVMGVYGRQVPLPDTTPADKRDLWITFGLDRKRQHRDYFFHNANSMIRRSAWEKVPFNENINGVEDQDWAQSILRQNGLIIYEPSAGVYHQHGIHNNGNPERTARVVRMIELIQKDLS